MRRSGFTMVELIFVIVIIGILSAVALPKFGGIKDKAKVNSELSAMSSLDSAITAQIEFRLDDFNDRNISWHDDGSGNLSENIATKTARYAQLNTDGKVLKGIAKKSNKFKIVSYLTAENGRLYANGSRPNTSDVLFLVADASNPNFGVTPNSDFPNNDAEGKPDNNDVWVFNPNNFDINVTSNNSRTPIHNTTVQIPAQSITLVDVDAASGALIADLRAIDSNGVSNGVSNPREVAF